MEKKVLNGDTVLTMREEACTCGSMQVIRRNNHHPITGNKVVIDQCINLNCDVIIFKEIMPKRR